MNFTPFLILIVIALILSIIALVKPAWPLIPIAVLFICVALLIGKT